mmetsp:Transcript_32238/g.72735  ORF Transcript_32238/g.72735 Transcript_32238/m.72735 type:complete len:206 (+) Transcript_32238:422-1039(+)
MEGVRAARDGRRRQQLVTRPPPKEDPPTVHTKSPEVPSSRDGPRGGGPREGQDESILPRKRVLALELQPLHLFGPALRTALRAPRGLRGEASRGPWPGETAPRRRCGSRGGGGGPRGALGELLGDLKAPGEAALQGLPYALGYARHLQLSQRVRFGSVARGPPRRRVALSCLLPAWGVWGGAARGLLLLLLELRPPNRRRRGRPA